MAAGDRQKLPVVKKPLVPISRYHCVIMHTDANIQASSRWSTRPTRPSCPMFNAK
jgi:hypothetical protein